MTWVYKGQYVFDLPEDCVGFVYLITNTIDGGKYIGKKLAKFSKTTYKMHTQKNGKKVRKRVKKSIDSDWLTYWGSCEELNLDIQKYSHEYFHREILYFCKSKAECSYLEAREQMDRRVLEKPEYYNNAMMLRVHGNHILGKI